MIGMNPQEPYTDEFKQAFDNQNHTFTDAIRKAMYLRYGLHRYHYTQFHKSSTEGGAVFRPLFYDYPDDEE
jgi:alpha-glucosidase (family GH31 glycosyl hydrolase)